MTKVLKYFRELISFLFFLMTEVASDLQHLQGQDWVHPDLSWPLKIYCFFPLASKLETLNL